MRYPVLFFCLFSLILSCSTSKQTKSILLPQEDGKTGKIVMRSETSGIMLDKPYIEAVYHATTGGFVTRQTDPDETRLTYGPLLAAEPDMSDPADLTSDSGADLPQGPEMIQPQ